jgi:hypothetical protein
MNATTPARTWTRTPDGYRAGDAEITDNGAGLGPAAGSGRWALTIAGRWVENLDTLAEAKVAAARLLERAEAERLEVARVAEIDRRAMLARRIGRARRADAAAYVIERNLRLGRYQGRNSRSTEATLDMHRQRFDAEVGVIVGEFGDDGRLVGGLLTTERDLRRRVGEARDAGERRPELAARLARVRTNLRMFGAS